jgi:glucosyl-3-phosphoglycerate synthase
MLFPEAAEFIQPLAGEYAGKRDFLEQAIFYSGYSVEVALLLQAILEMGPECTAQVFLDERTHPLQDVPSLGKMAGNILYTLLHLAEKYKRLTLHVDVAQQVKVFSAITGIDKEITSKMIFVADSPLPRMIDLHSYKAKRLHKNFNSPDNQ